MFLSPYDPKLWYAYVINIDSNFANSKLQYGPILACFCHFLPFIHKIMIYCTFTENESTPAKFDLNTWNLAKMTLRYIQKKVTIREFHILCFSPDLCHFCQKKVKNHGKNRYFLKKMWKNRVKWANIKIPNSNIFLYVPHSYFGQVSAL